MSRALPSFSCSFTKRYVVCAALALAAVWLHRYPAGIDLPQHANQFQILAHYGDPHSGYRFFYYIDFFTPYAVLYLLAWPLTKIGGALFAVKVLLSLSALATPIALERWLRSVGGEASLGILGFAVAFGFGYQWGFLSFVLSGPVSLFYLASVEELKREPAVRRLGLAAALAVLLFFTHGITFAIVMVASGLGCLMQRSLRKVVVALLHFLPTVAVLIPWYFSHRGEAAGDFRDLPNNDRIISLFSGLFCSDVNYAAALVALGIAGLLFAVGRPTLSMQPGRVLPLLLALVGLFGISEWVGDTWLVGTRFCQFVYLYGAGAFDFRTDERGVRRLSRVALAITVGVLCSINYRLRVFNEELTGLEEVKKRIPAGRDVQLFLGHADSAAFGGAALRQVVAWTTADQGGFLENDIGRYFQIPVQRRPSLPWPTEFPYLVTRGDMHEARAAVGRAPELVASAGHFRVFAGEVTPLQVPGLEVVRFAQSWKKPAQDRAVGGGALLVAGRRYDAGIGTHARSVLEMRAGSRIHRIHGSVGMDDGAPAEGHALFRIMDARRHDLWVSREMTQGEPAMSFDVSFDRLDGDLFLVTQPVGDVLENAHTDWLDVAAVP
jgi:hypothetical protein